MLTNKLIKSAFCAVLGLVATPAMALTVYECDIKERGNSGWVSEKIIVVHDENTGEVVVHSPIIYHFNADNPLLGEVSVENKKRITFVWRLRDIVKDKSNTPVPNLMYRLTYTKSNGAAQVYGKPTGYENNFFGTGKCKKTTE